MIFNHAVTTSIAHGGIGAAFLHVAIGVTIHSFAPLRFILLLGWKRRRMHLCNDTFNIGATEQGIVSSRLQSVSP